MNHRLKNMSAAVLCSVSLVLAAGCANDAQTGSLAGAGIGALAGQAIGGNTGSTLIGAGAGAAAGYIVGNEMDKQRRRNNVTSCSVSLTVSVVETDGTMKTATDSPVVSPEHPYMEAALPPPFH